MGSFLRLSDIPLGICTITSESTHLDGHLGCFRVLAAVTSATVNTGVRVSFSIIVFSGSMPSSRISGSYDSFIPSILRKLCTVSHSGYNNCTLNSARGFPFLHTLSGNYCLQVF